MSDSVSRAPLQRGGKGDKHAVVPASDFRSYYDRPVVKEPVWTYEVPWYFFSGGIAGAGALLAAAARVAGNDELATRTGRVVAVAAAVSPPLLIADLGVPSRFANMLRVFKPTSPLNIGSWVLSAFVPAAIGSAALDALGWFPRLQRTAEGAAALLGPAMSTYTAVLVANTAVPAWQEARAELPAVFAGSAAASAGAAAMLVTPLEHGGPARRLALIGAAAELGASKVMDKRLGELAEPYHIGAAAKLEKAANGLTAAGAGILMAGRRSRLATAVGSVAILGGSLAKRWAVFKAGFASARDPKYVVRPQRRRLAERGAVRD